MDFEFSEEQRALAGLCDEIFGSAPPGERPGRDLPGPVWRAAAGAGLLGILLSAERGGPALGTTGGCIVARHSGAAGVTLPVSDALATFGALDALCESGLLPSVPELFAAGEHPAFMPLGYGGADPAADGPVADPATRVLTGGAVLAPAAARWLLIWARTADGGPAAAMLDVRRTAGEQRLAPGPAGQDARYVIDGVIADHVVSSPSVTAARERSWLLSLLLSSAELGGLAEAALQLTAGYAARRHQFGRPIGTFQAVAGGLADCYIDAQAMQWTLWRAAGRFDSVAPEPGAVEVARIWAAEGADRILAAAQHIHGGLGVDVELSARRLFPPHPQAAAQPAAARSATSPCSVPPSPAGRAGDRPRLARVCLACRRQPAFGRRWPADPVGQRPGHCDSDRRRRDRLPRLLSRPS